MSCYFDDLVLENNYKDPLQRGWILEQKFEIIRESHEALDKDNSPNGDHYDHEAIINDKKWLEILEVEVIAKNNLAEILSDDEKEIFNQKIDYI